MRAAETLASNDCYLALKARDARFDGCFFTGVTSTGIYCRPVCSARTPKRENCVFFRYPAQAESAGFRPCLRCRPELAPHALAWSMQDASTILAHQAARLLDEPEAAGERPASIEHLAARLGISDRHLRRIFEAQFGVSPIQYLQTRRLHTAKQLLADTGLPITNVALMSGYTSVRRFNDAFLQHYRLNPTQLRRQSPRETDGHVSAMAGMTVRLGYRPPYDTSAMMAFFGKRAIGTIEFIAQNEGITSLTKTFCIQSGGKTHSGWLRAHFDETRSHLVLTVSDTLRGVLPQVIHRTRALFDLDADPQAINALLHADFPSADGLRVPGTLDGFELAVRAVLGQQITVAAARTLAQRLVNRFGEPIQTPWPQLTHVFPTPTTLAALELTNGDALGPLGIVRQRQTAIVSMARALVDGRLSLQAGANVSATVAALKDLPGIGEWTAQYIAMRALRWPDAFLAGDAALHKALGLQGLGHPARRAELASLAWKPWRSYAVIRLWQGCGQANLSSAPESIAFNDQGKRATAPNSIKTPLPPNNLLRTTSR